MSIRGAESAFPTPDTTRLGPVRVRGAAAERPVSQHRVAPSRLSRGLKALSYIASPFRLEAVERAELGRRSADEIALQLGRIGRALDEALAEGGDRDRLDALSLGRALVGDIGQRFQLAASLSFAEGEAL